MKPKISICIPVFNKFSFTRQCIKDLSYLNNVEIIVVDNASTDETSKELIDNKNIVYYRLSKNYGFSVACNVAYNLSKSDNVLFLNNDIVVRSEKETWIESILEKCHLGLVGPTMGQLDKNLNFIQEKDEYLKGISYMSGWCLGGSKKIFEKIHIERKSPNIIDSNFKWQIFSEEYFAYFEDTSLSLRAREKGVKFNVVKIPVVHFKHQTSKQLNTNLLYNKSREIFLKNWKDKIKKIKFD